MFLGTLKQGFNLSDYKFKIWILGIILFLLYLKQKTLTTYLFLVSLNINFALILGIFLLYLGSDLGRRWLVGISGFLFFFIADPYISCGLYESVLFLFKFFFLSCKHGCPNRRLISFKIFI